MLPTKISIRRFFYSFLFLAVILPLLSVGGISLFISSRMLKEEILKSNHSKISYYSDKIEQYLEKPVAVLNTLSRQLRDGQHLDNAIKEQILKSFVDSYDIVMSIQVADDQGMVNILYPQDELFIGSDISGHEYFRKVKESGWIYWSPSSITEHLDAPVTSLSYPLDDGVLTAILSLEEISSLFDNMESDKEELVLYVTDQKGVYIAHSDKKKVLLQEYDPRYIEYKLEGKDKLTSEMEYEGREYSVYSRIIESSRWMVTLLRPVDAINKPLRNISFSLMVVTALVILSVLLFSNFPRKNLARPLVSLTHLTRKISLGDYDISIPGLKIDELDQLGKSIDKMSLEIKSREDALRNARTYLYNIIDSMPSILIGIDTELKITQWNHKAEEDQGIDARSAMGRELMDVVPRLKKHTMLIRKAIEGREIQSVTVRSSSMRGGSNKIENLIVYPLTSQIIHGAVIRIDNVTDKVLMEEILIQNEKMLSVGGLAAGMAHEINNPLAGMIQTANVLSGRLGLERRISANEKAAEEASLSLESLKKYMEIREIPTMLESLNISGKRIAAIVTNMLSFVRGSGDSTSTHSINEIIDHSLELAITDYNLRKKYDFLQIEIIKNYGENLPGVVCEMSKIQQVFFNILQNGAHAMSNLKEEKPRFVIKTYYDKENKLIITEISDNGPGMEEAVRRRIFEPFFTTKPVGIGTGLGLSVSYFIITENQKGEMLVESSPGKGANFIIKLPVHI